MESFTVQQYMNAGCVEIFSPPMVAVHGITGGRICDTGCHAFHGGRCVAFKQLTTAVLSPEPQVEKG